MKDTRKLKFGFIIAGAIVTLASGALVLAGEWFAGFSFVIALAGTIMAASLYRQEYLK